MSGDEQGTQNEGEIEVTLKLPEDLEVRARAAGINVDNNLDVIDWLLSEMERLVAGMNLKEMAAQLQAMDFTIPREGESTTEVPPSERNEQSE